MPGLALAVWELDTVQRRGEGLGGEGCLAASIYLDRYKD